ncbi:MAG: helical backbone metal receptor [Proteobacteria bacterium]|nr:helical backbone metal receptor [Pseudomonadota bacterium]
MRIVSLVPSLTHLICEVGLRDYLVGCTNFCVDPPGLYRSVALIGGTKDPDLLQIQKLNPTHILANKEENNLQDIQFCSKIGRLFDYSPTSINEVPTMFDELAETLELPDLFDAMKNKLTSEIASLKGRKNRGSKSFIYLVWKNPLMAAGPSTYISSILEAAGFKNIIDDSSSRYPKLSIQDIQNLKPEVVFLSSEPYPFRQRDKMDMIIHIPESTSMEFIDGKLMSWFGARSANALSYVRTLL